MVSKITLFEPHFDGAQIGPATLGAETVPETGLAETESAAPPASEAKSVPGTSAMPSASNIRSRVRTIVGAGMVAFGLLVGAIAVRRFRARKRDAEGQTDAESEEEPRIEERPRSPSGGVSN